MNNKKLVNYLMISGVLHTPKIIEAFLKVDREHFVPDELKDKAYIDAPLPIGNAQTISQPSTVAFMLELLGPKEGDRILDIGSGSAWTTSLLCYIVGKNGKVIGLERVDQLIEQGQKNLDKFNFYGNCKIKKAKEEIGLPGKKFDRILVSASAQKLPQALLHQLDKGGVMVIPVKNSIFKFEKLFDGTIKQSEYPGFVFVPLVI
jgi:protein-L-isoaspartate(D-aspartate) O-methyltransferase